MIHLEYVDRAQLDADGAGGLHALRLADLRRGLPGRRDQADRRRRGADGAQAALHRLQQLRAGLPVRRAEDERPSFELMMKCDMCYDRTSAGKKPMCATVCPSGALFFGTREEIEHAAAALAADQHASGSAARRSRRRST